MNEETKNKIITDYLSGSLTTKALAKKYKTTTKTIQRLAKTAGVLRSRSESMKLSSELRNYSETALPKWVREHRKTITQEHRKLHLSNFPECTVCGIWRGNGRRMEVVYKPNTNYRLLETLCRHCLAKKK